MVFRAWSGLGLLEAFVRGTGKVGGGPRGDERMRDIGKVVSGPPLSPLRVKLSGGRGGSFGVALGSSDICMGGTVSPPSQDACCSSLGVAAGD